MLFLQLFVKNEAFDSSNDKKIFVSEERSIIAFNYTPAHRLCEGPITGIILALLQLRFSLYVRREMPLFSV